jgi:DsbC/DsbD-like thiol-disulfide interchange protein
MIYRICIGWVFGMAAVAEEPVRSGRATAEWLAESITVESGKPLRTAVRLVIDSPWHTYWRNPGEAGMPTGAKWKLPDGWRVGEFSHPVPKPFLTGELAAYGHEGTVFFPVEVTAPIGFDGAAVLNATVSWLACNDDACVPGEVELTLKVSAGGLSPTAAAPDIAHAFERKPAAASHGVRLTVREEDKVALLTVTGNPPFDLAAAKVYAQSPELLDSTAKIIFQKSADTWQARVAKSPYASGPIAGLELLFVPPAPQRAFVLTQ